MHPIGKLSCLIFLLPANKVWGRAKFSEVSVILFMVGGGSTYSGSASRGSAYRGVCLQRVCLWRGLHPGGPDGGDGEGGWSEPPESEKHVVHILLECFLVLKIFNLEFIQCPGFRVALEN